MNTLKQNIKSWLIQWLTILLVLTIWWISYATFTNFDSLQVNSWDTLTASKWNDIVDAIKDEYSTEETLTNKIWLWESVYRKVIELTTPSSTTGAEYDVSANFTWASNCRIIHHLSSKTTWRNTTNTQSSAIDTDIKSDCSLIRIKIYTSTLYSRPIKIVVEYTK